MAGLRDLRRELIMTGSGWQQISVPSAYQFMSVMNTSDNTLMIYSSYTTPEQRDTAPLIGIVPLYTMMTLPLNVDTQYTIFWTNGSGTTGSKQIQVIFSERNLNLNGIMGSPITSGSVTLSSDGVGLAKEAQFPALPVGGNMRVQVMAELPEGTKKIGKVEIEGGTVSVANPSSVAFSLRALTTTPVQITGAAGSTFDLQAQVTNTQNVLIGDAAGQYFALVPGQVYSLPANAFYAKSQAGTANLVVVEVKA
jgi:hypothetical protein